MEQQGYIVEIVDERTAKLKMQRHSACASCGKCATTSEKQDIIVEVDNTLGAKLGDRVKVNMESVNVLKAVLIVYLLPLVVLLVSTVGTYFALSSFGDGFNVEVISGAVGIVMMAISYLLLKKKDSGFRESREFIPIITEVVLPHGSEIKL